MAEEGLRSLAIHCTGTASQRGIRQRAARMEIRTYQGTSVHVYMYGAFPRLQFVYNIMHFIYIRPLKRPEWLGISDMIRLVHTGQG